MDGHPFRLSSALLADFFSDGTRQGTIQDFRILLVPNKWYSMDRIRFLWLKQSVRTY